MRLVSSLKEGLKRSILRDPIMLSMAVIVVLFLSYSALELWRSNQYQTRMEEYTQSAKVQNVVAEIDRLAKAVEEGDKALVCDLSVASTLQEKESQDTSAMLGKIHEDVLQLINNRPSYESAAVYLPAVRDSREMSGYIDNAIESLHELSKPTSISAYCHALNGVLSQSEFLADISKREGVSALSVGQIERFVLNFDKVQQAIATVRPVPAEFSAQHEKIVQLYTDITPLLREDTTNFVVFSSNIEQKLIELDSILQEIKQTATGLQQLPEQLQIQSATLR